METTQPVLYTEEPPSRKAYAELFDSTGWNEGYLATPAELETALAASWYSLCASTPGGELVGYGRIISDGVLYAFICDLIVAPSYQCQGIGTHILDRMVECCEASGLRVVFLFSAVGKGKFYERAGFAPRPADGPGMQLNLHSRRAHRDGTDL